jgi:predicted RNA-binding Zn-ribbon protein involved in translation (DUF1610 family)
MKREKSNSSLNLPLFFFLLYSSAPLRLCVSSSREVLAKLNKKPRFFCDNCGSEVGQNAKACQNCGRYFASVRCPSCGFTGDEASFKNGCPSCGYSAAPTGAPPAPEKKAAKKSETLVPAGKLPLWVYILSICAFIGVCAVLVYRLI